MAGRRPLPTALKILTGNPGKRKLNRREPKGRPGVPACPKHVRGLAQEAWYRLGGQLATLRVLTDADGTALELCCLAYQEYRAALAVLQRRGTTYATRTANGMIIRRRPEAAAASDAWRRVKGMLIELGLTPSARTKVTTTDLPTGDAVDEFLFGRPR